MYHLTFTQLNQLQCISPAAKQYVLGAIFRSIIWRCYCEWPRAPGAHKRNCNKRWKSQTIDNPTISII